MRFVSEDLHLFKRGRGLFMILLVVILLILIHLHCYLYHTTLVSSRFLLLDVITPPKTIGMGSTGTISITNSCPYQPINYCI